MSDRMGFTMNGKHDQEVDSVADSIVEKCNAFIARSVESDPQAPLDQATQCFVERMREHSQNEAVSFAQKVSKAYEGMVAQEVASSNKQLVLLKEENDKLKAEVECLKEKHQNILFGLRKMYQDL